MEERTYLHLVEATVPQVEAEDKKYIFFGPDGLKEAMTKALLLKAKVTRIRVFPDGSVKEMVIYSGIASTATAATASSASEA
jgi:hypothetical protein